MGLEPTDKLDEYASLQNRNRCQSFQHPPFARTSKTQSMIELLFRPGVITLHRWIVREVVQIGYCVPNSAAGNTYCVLMKDEESS